MNTQSPIYNDARIAAGRLVTIKGWWSLPPVLRKFGAARVGELDPREIPAFIAACWVGPRVRRVK
jgi:hypothetical protein